jgi:hypothetical protein
VRWLDWSGESNGQPRRERRAPPLDNRDIAETWGQLDSRALVLAPIQAREDGASSFTLDGTGLVS